MKPRQCHPAEHRVFLPRETVNYAHFPANHLVLVCLAIQTELSESEGKTTFTLRLKRNAFI
jgi:hypothetical protein